MGEVLQGGQRKQRRCVQRLQDERYAMKPGQLVRISGTWDGIVLRLGRPGWCVVAYVDAGKKIIKAMPIAGLEKRK